MKALNLSKRKEAATGLGAITKSASRMPAASRPSVHSSHWRRNRGPRLFQNRYTGRVLVAITTSGWACSRSSCAGMAPKLQTSTKVSLPIVTGENTTGMALEAMMASKSSVSGGKTYVSMHDVTCSANSWRMILCHCMGSLMRPATQ